MARGWGVSRRREGERCAPRPHERWNFLPGCGPLGGFRFRDGAAGPSHPRQVGTGAARARRAGQGRAGRGGVGWGGGGPAREAPSRPRVAGGGAGAPRPAAAPSSSPEGRGRGPPGPLPSPPTTPRPSPGAPRSAPGRGFIYPPGWGAAGFGPAFPGHLPPAPPPGLGS